MSRITKPTPKTRVLNPSPGLPNFKIQGGHIDIYSLLLDVISREAARLDYLSDFSTTKRRVKGLGDLRLIGAFLELKNDSSRSPFTRQEILSNI